MAPGSPQHVDEQGVEVTGMPQVDARWIKSPTSGDDLCVEVAFPSPDVVLVRNSRAPHGSVLSFTRNQWIAFTACIRNST